MLCPACDERAEAARKRTEAAKAAGYRCWANTPEYKRLQREAEAAKRGRLAVPYIPQSVRKFRSRMHQAERMADRIRARWAAEWLRPFRNRLYDADPLYREEVKAINRERYRRRRSCEVNRVAEYKLANPERNRAWSRARIEREIDLSDGTASKDAIARLKERATHCAYCDVRLIDKHTDHMIPLLLGGEHSLRNIVIVCPECNARKARLSYPEWVQRVDPEHRPRVIALYRERYERAVEAAA